MLRISKAKVVSCALIWKASVNKPRRIFVFDNLREELEDIQSECQDLGLPLYLKHYVRPDFQQIFINPETNAFFPANLNEFEKEQSLGGGTASVFSIKHRDTGQRLVLKFGAHEDGAKVEMLCKCPLSDTWGRCPKNACLSYSPKKTRGRFAITTSVSLRHSYVNSSPQVRPTHQP